MQRPPVRVGLASGLALLLLLWAATAMALPEQTWVLAIGNNFGDPDEIGLRYAERDAREFADVLHQLGGVPAGRIRVLADGSAEAVVEALDEIERRLAETAGPSALVVFYSGHADAHTLHLGGTRLAFADLRGRIEASRATLRLLIVDACGSGGVSRVKGVTRAPTFAVEVEDGGASEGMAVITSSTANESSQESDRLQASFFSHHLVNGLRGAADADEDGVVSLDEAYAYSYAETLRSSGRTMTLQHPTYNVDLKGKGQVVLTRPARPGSRLGRVELGQAVVHLVSGPDGALVAELHPGRPRAEVALPARRYRVQERLPRVYRQYAFELRPGQRLALADLDASELRYDRLVRKGGGVDRAIHGLSLLGGARGEIVPGDGATGHLVLGYGLDTRWLTAGVRLRGTRAVSRTPIGGAERIHSELGLGLTAEHIVDTAWLSLSFGVALEGMLHSQTFADDEPDRRAGALGVGALFALERVLWRGISLRLEAGPTTTLLRRAAVAGGAITSVADEAVLTWWSSGGLKWRL